MSRNGAGTYTLPAGNPVTTGTVISSTWANTTLSDIGSALTNCLTRDGQSPATANIPMGNYKLTGLGQASSTGDALGWNQNATVGTLSAGTSTVSSLVVGSLSGLLKGSSGTVSAATSGTDYLAPPSGTAILKANSGGALANAVSGTDYAPATSGTAILKGNGSGGFSNAVSSTDYAPATSGTSILYGNGSGGFSSVTVGTGLSFSGGTLSNSGQGIGIGQSYSLNASINTNTNYTNSGSSPILVIYKSSNMCGEP